MIDAGDTAGQASGAVYVLDRAMKGVHDFEPVVVYPLDEDPTQRHGSLPIRAPSADAAQARNDALDLGLVKVAVTGAS